MLANSDIGLIWTWKACSTRVAALGKPKQFQFI